ncbi:hypothetical protein ACFP2T_46500 [Plantactinospora solaniradicis]|uniref:Uncharacterized protein n=1 Tax=Plantactinospora solaniradicis TaxID=1723736 RepID=A0ABW1KPN3_9ACTN
MKQLACGVREWGLDHGDAFGGDNVVEGGGVLGVAVADQESELVGALAEVHGEVAGLLGYPLPGGVGGDAEEVDPSGGHLHNHQRVKASQQDGVEVEEVDRQQASGLVVQEGTPAGVLMAGRRADTSADQDPSDRARSDPMAEPLKFALDAAVPPSRILSGHP